MATLISNANGNLTGATTFAGVETGTSALALIRANTTTIATAASATSPTFTVTNSKVIDGALLWVYLSSGTAGTGTFKVDLQKGGVSQAAVTVNKSDLPDATTTTPIPVFFKFTSTATGDGGSNWTIVLTTVSGTGSGVITYSRNSGTAADYTRALRTTTAATPAAADDLYIVGELTGAGTHNSITVAMNSTATTAYGNGVINSSSVNGGGVRISNYGTLTYGTSSPADPYNSNTKLLMGFESGSMVDESSAAHGAIGANNVSTTTSDFVFGTRSMWWASTGAYTFYGFHSDWEISNQPFTFEMRIKMQASGGGPPSILRTLFLRDAGTQSYYWYVDTSTGAMVLSINGSTVCSGGSMSFGVWYAVCADFDGTKYRLYIDGVMVASSTTLVTATSGTALFFIGSSNGGSNQFWGFMDEIRFTKGTGRYANDSGYTLATAAFPRPTDVVVSPAAGINYVLRVNGDVEVYQFGTLNIGSSGFEIPRTSTAVLEIQQNSASGDFGLWLHHNCTANGAGLSRTSAKNVVKCRLTSDVVSSNVITGTTNINSTSTANAGLEASGNSLLATTLADNGSNATHSIAHTGPSITNTTQTASVWLARGSGTNNRFVRVTMGNNTNQASVTNGFFSDIDLQAGTAGTVTVVGTGTATSVSITAVLGGYLIRMTGKVASTSATPSLLLNACSAAGTTSFAGASNVCFIYDHVAIITASSISDTTFNVDTDTGWLSGDAICVAATSRARLECEIYPLNANAGASSMVSGLYPFTGVTPLTNGTASHSGTSPTQAEVGLLTRNVKIRSTSSTLMTFVAIDSLASVNMSWVEFYYTGSNNSNKHGIEFFSSGGSPVAKSFTYCSIHDCGWNAFLFSNGGSGTVGSQNVTIQNTIVWYTPNTTAIFQTNAQITASDWTLDNILVMITGQDGITLSDFTGTVTNTTVVGANASGFYFQTQGGLHYNMNSFDNNGAHACGQHGMAYGIPFLNGTISNFKTWRNITNGILFFQNVLSTNQLIWNNLINFGNGSNGINFSLTSSSDLLRLTGTNVIAGDTTFSMATTFNIQSQNIVVMQISNLDAKGDVSNIFQPATTRDFLFGPTTAICVQGILNNCRFGSPTLISPKSLWQDNSYMQFQKYGWTAGDHRTELTYGQLRTDTSVYKAASPSMQMTPNNASNKLQSATPGRGIQVAVNNAYAITASVYVRKDSAYIGNQPRLIVRANAAIGINVDTVLATLTSTGTLPTMLDYATAGVGVTLSNSNLTVVNINQGGARVKLAEGKTSGKYYVEFTLDRIMPGGAVNSCIGACNQNATSDVSIGNNGTNGAYLFFGNGSILADGNGQTGLGTRANGDVIGLAIDLTNYRAWFRVAPSGNWNNNGAANPATNTGGYTITAGTIVPVTSFSGGGILAGNSVTANFGATTFVGAVPSGFTSGWPTSQTGIGTQTWEQFTGTTIGATDDGVMEFIVDCDGTAGFISIDDWAFTAAPASQSLVPSLFADSNVFFAPTVAGGSGVEAVAFLARTSGLDTTHTNAYGVLINGLVADSLWSKFDVLYIYATQDSTTALLNLISSNFNGVANGSPTFTADRGFTGVDASTSVYIETSFNPTTATSPKFTQNSAHISAWSLTNAASSSSGGVMIGNFVSALNYLLVRRPGDIDYYAITGSTNPATISDTNSVAHFLANRDSSTTTQGYKNGSQVQSVSVSSTSLSSSTITVMAARATGSTVNNGAGFQHAMASIGSSLSSTDVTNFYNRLLTYMTTVGAVLGPVAAFLARTSGLDTTHVNAYTALINGLVTDGIWSKLDVLHIYATQDSTTAQLNLVSSSFGATLGSTPTFTADRGYTGTEGSGSVWINTSFNPSTASSPKFVQNSAHLSTWSVGVPGNRTHAIGAYNLGAVAAVVDCRDGNGDFTVVVNANISTGLANVTNANTGGHYIGNRSASNAQQGYKNGSSVITNSSASLAVANLNIYTLGYNTNGGPTGNGLQCAMASIGSSLDATDATNFYNRLLTYLTSLGGIAGTEAAAFLARTSGLDFIHINAYTALINGLVADGIWSKLDVLHIYATQDSTTALLNLISSSYTGSTSGGPTFTADQGFTGASGSGSVGISTHFNPATATSPQYVQNSAHVSAWSLTSAAAGGSGAGIIIGAQSSGSAQTTLFPRYSDGNSYFRVNGSGIGGVSNGDGKGHYIANRSSSSAVQGYKNGSSVLSASDTSAAVFNFDINVLCQNNAGAVATGFGGQCAMASIGSSLNSTDTTNFYNRLRTYMTAVGVVAGPGTEAAAFLARTSGLDATHRFAYTDLINGLVADGVWSKLDVLHIYATQNTTTAQLNLVSSSYPATLNGSPTFTADRGYTGVDGSSTVYISTGFNPTTAPSPKFVQDSAHLSVWNVTNTMSNNVSFGTGGAAGASNYVWCGYSGDGNAYFRINVTSVGGAQFGFTGNDASGLFIGNRSGASAIQGYKNNSSIMSRSDASIAPINQTIVSLGANGGTPGGTAGQQAAISIGSSLSSTDVTNFYNRLRTYMTAVGVP